MLRSNPHPPLPDFAQHCAPALCTRAVFSLPTALLSLSSSFIVLGAFLPPNFRSLAPCTTSATPTMHLRVTLAALPLLFAYTAVSAPLPDSSTQNWSSTDTHLHRYRSRTSTSSYAPSGTATSSTVAAASVSTTTLRPSVNPAATYSSKYRISSATDYSATTTSTASLTTASSSTSNSTIGWGLRGAQKNGVYIGWLPDDGESFFFRASP